jgi:Protein of unknown function DUF115
MPPLNDKPVFAPVGKIECHMATPIEEVAINIRSALKRKLPEIENLPEWGKLKGDEPFAIAGGAPSIRYTVDTLRNFRTIIAAGSAHDWLREHGVPLRYCIVLDPDPAAANYLKNPDPLCTYLVASCCHASVFDLLKDYPVVRYHSAGHDLEWYEEELAAAGLAAPSKPLIGGGPTCGLRAVSMAYLLGYRNLHFFGLDSNLDPCDNAHHAYSFVDPENEHLGDVVELSLVQPPEGRVWYVAKYMLAQLDSFKDLIDGYGHHFKVTVHGDSVLQEFWRRKQALTAQRVMELASESTHGL